MWQSGVFVYSVRAKGRKWEWSGGKLSKLGNEPSILSHASSSSKLLLDHFGVCSLAECMFVLQADPRANLNCDPRRKPILKPS